MKTIRPFSRLSAEATQAEQFLSTLLALAPEGTWLELRGFAAGRCVHRSWYPCNARGFAEAASIGVEVASDGADVYAGVNPRREYGVGRAGDIACVVAVVADVDVGLGKTHPAHAGAVQCIERFSTMVQPSLVVCSGSGFHVYYRLSEPATDEDAWTAQELSERLALALGANGQRLDSISDPPRILRLPGTLNYKAGAAAPSPVALVVSTEQVHHLQDLDAVLPPLSPEDRKALRMAHGPEGSTPVPLPVDIPPRLKMVLEATGWNTHEVRTHAGHLVALVLDEICPACAEVHIPGREPPRPGTAHISPVAGRLRCKRSRCPASSGGLRLEEWVFKYRRCAAWALGAPIRRS